MTQPISYFQQVLPDELCRLVLKRLDAYDQARLSQTCKRLWLLSLDRPWDLLQNNRALYYIEKNQPLPKKIAELVTLLIFHPEDFSSKNKPLFRDTLKNTPFLEHLFIVKGGLEKEDVPFLTSAFTYLHRLKTLDVSGNGLAEASLIALIKALYQLTSLTHLNLSSNHLSIEGIAALVKTLPQLPHLKELYLKDNKDSDSPAVYNRVFYPPSQLTHLALGRSRFCILTLAQALCQVTSLNYLDLGHNAVTIEAAPFLAQAFSFLPSLTHLNLESSWLAGGRALVVIAALARLSRLTYLKLGNIAIAPPDIPEGHTYESIWKAQGMTLVYSLSHMPKLKQLHIPLINLEDEAAVALAALFPRLSHLSHIDLSYNCFEEVGAIALGRGLVSLPRLKWLKLGFVDREEKKLLWDLCFPSLPTLTYLDVSGSEIGERGVALFTKSLSHSINLQRLDLSTTRLPDEGITTLSQALLHLPLLTYLDLSFNKIGKQGMLALAQVLPSIPNLQYLNLSFNEIEEEGAMALFRVLPLLSQLAHLGLQRNTIGPLGASLFAQLLPHLPRKAHITHFDWSFNHLQDEGVSALAQALPHLPSLTQLNLSSNQIGEKGAVALAKVLPQLPHLQALTLRDNKLGNAGAIAIARSLPYLENLKHLDLSGNRIGPSGIEALNNGFSALTCLKVIYLSY